MKKTDILISIFMMPPPLPTALEKIKRQINPLENRLYGWRIRFINHLQKKLQNS